MNAFLTAAEKLMPAPVKAKHRIRELRSMREAEKLRIPGAAEKQINEERGQFAVYRRWKREQWRAALLGTYGEHLTELKHDLVQFGPDDAAALVKHVQIAAREWIKSADRDTRFIAFQLCTSRIERIRKNLGLPVFDDALPDAPDCAAIACRKAILGEMR